MPIPATDTVIHYGKAQTETELTLTPGKHTLQRPATNCTPVPTRL